jgi:hypothetical protein
MIGFSYAEINPDFDENELWDDNNLKFLPLKDVDGIVNYPILRWIKTDVKA